LKIHYPEWKTNYGSSVLRFETILLNHGHRVHIETQRISVKLCDLRDSVVKVRLRYFLVCNMVKLLA